jgi:anti-sigma factor RsiW
MADCRELESLCTRYVDGEAAPEQRAAVDAHISLCPPCRVKVAEERAARDVLAAGRDSLRATAPEGLRARCAAHRAASAAGVRASATARLVKWVPLSLAATLILAIGGLFVYSALNQVEALAAQLAVDHMKCFQFEGAPQDPAVAASQWAAANGWPVQVPASAPERNLEFISLRRCLVTEGRTAHMMYQWRGQPLSLFVVPDAMHDGRPAERIVERFGHEAIIWSSQDRTYVVMARGRPAEADIRPVVGYMKAHAR